MKFQDEYPDCGNEYNDCHGPVGIEDEPDISNLIQLKFFGSQFSFQNENALVEGQIIDQSHQVDLVMRVMELARDGGKELRIVYGNGTLHFKTISDKDIELCRKQYENTEII